MLGAELAGSRPIVDNGWLEKARQVGKSGTKVKPKLYVAVGVSGAPEHLEGMARADLIVAVNSDAHAPIFGAAHFGTTVDLFELLPALADTAARGLTRMPSPLAVLALILAALLVAAWRAPPADRRHRPRAGRASLGPAVAAPGLRRRARSGCIAGCCRSVCPAASTR